MIMTRSLLACGGSAGAFLAACLLNAGLAVRAPEARAATPPAAAIATVAPAQAGFGTIKGRLIYGGADAPKAPEIDAKNQDFCKTKTIVDRALMVDPKTKGVANGLVWINGPKGKNPEAEKALVSSEPKVRIDNKDCEFVPRATALFKGQQVEFTSSDPTGHNSHVTGFSQGTNLALAPKGTATTKLQAEKRPLSLKCDIHGWMQGWILVSDHPFFAVTGPDGSFEIKGVPAGTQNLIVWQEKAGYVSQGAAKGQPVVVAAGGVVDLGDVVLDPTKVKK